jgi:dCTP deaminase
MATDTAGRRTRINAKTASASKRARKVAAVPGVLNDRDIVAEADKNRLIVQDFRLENVQQACYELRVGSIYYDLCDDARRVDLSDGEYVLLKPFQQVVVITCEELAIPPDIIVRILLKGRMFSLGIAPVHTYADPGFSGRLGIVLSNMSRSYIRLEQGSAIAKIEFERLPKPVQRPYRGQHGFQSEVWPIPKHLTLSEAEIERDRRIGTPGIELGRAFGGEFGRLVDRIFMYERRLLLSVLAYIFLAMIIIAFSTLRETAFSTLVAFSIGLVTNLASAVLIFLATSLRRPRHRSSDQTRGVPRDS